MIGIWLWILFVSAFVTVGVLAFLDGVAELPPCIKGCHLDLSTGVVWHSPGCPNFERAAEEERVRQAEEDEAAMEADFLGEQGDESGEH